MSSSYLFTSESVSEGHPDKVADQISDAILDAILAEPDMSRTSRRIDVGEALRMVPILDPAWVAGAVLDESGFDIDVAALHPGYLRMAKPARWRRGFRRAPEFVRGRLRRGKNFPRADGRRGVFWR